MCNTHFPGYWSEHLQAVSAKTEERSSTDAEKGDSNIEDAEAKSFGEIEGEAVETLRMVPVQFTSRVFHIIS